MNNIYKSSSYINNINTKQVLILDIDDQYETDKKYVLGSSSKFNIKLREPLIIDNISELFLDNVITHNCNTTNDNDNSAFILNIDQFNVKTNVASNSSYTDNGSGQRFSNGNSIISDSIIIPNENNNINNYYSGVIHKSKKLNYLADIPSGRIDHLSGTITNLNGDPIFHGQHRSNNYTYMLQNINWKWNGNNSDFNGSDNSSTFIGDYNSSITNIRKNSEFVLSAGSASSTRIACVLLNDTRLKASEILFSTSASHSLVKTQFSNCSNLNMMLSSNPITELICDKEHGGTPNLSNPEVILKGLTSESSLSTMNLFLTKIPDTQTPPDPALGNPELYYESGRFLAEFTIIEKK